MILDHSDLKCISEKGQYFNFFCNFEKKISVGLEYPYWTLHVFIRWEFKEFKKFHYTSRNWFFMSYPEIKLNSFFQGKE